MSSRSLLPPNETQTLHDKDVALRSSLVDHTQHIDFNPKTCVPQMLPHLAQAYAMPFWDMDWKENIKRALVAEARDLHKHAGTPWCLLRILEIMGLSFPNEAEQALIIEYGNRNDYIHQIKRNSTHKYGGLHKHNGGTFLYSLTFGHWSEFGVVIKVLSSHVYIKYAITLMEMFKPTHTRLVGVHYEELPIRDGVSYKYNAEHMHGGSIIRKGE